MKSSRLSKRVLAPESKQTSILGHINVFKTGGKGNDFQFDYGDSIPNQKEISTAESTKKRPVSSNTIILVPKKKQTKKRKLSQLKDRKEPPSKKKLKVEENKKVTTPTFEISALSTSTKDLVAKLLK
jgi:hypothetical protein